MPQFDKVQRILSEVAVHVADITAAQTELAEWNNNWQSTQSRHNHLLAQLRTAADLRERSEFGQPVG